MFDDFLPIPDAESLPFYPMVLKLVVCVTIIDCSMVPLATEIDARPIPQSPPGFSRPSLSLSPLGIGQENLDS